MSGLARRTPPTAVARPGLRHERGTSDRGGRGEAPPVPAPRPATREATQDAVVEDAVQRGERGGHAGKIVLLRRRPESPPESRAVALGQAALRLVPLDRLSLFRVEEPGPGHGGRRRAPRQPAHPRGAVLRRDHPTARHGPRVRRGDGEEHHASSATGASRANLVRVRTEAGPGLVNCNGFKNPGLDAFARDVAQLPHRVPLIVSVAGETPEDCVALVRGLSPYGDLVEFNISSPNTRLVYTWSERPAELRALLEEVRAACPRPLIVKISPDFADANERDIIPAALEAGIRVVNYGNTRRVEDARLSQGGGGLSGPEIFPATLDNIRRTRARFGDRFDLIATGGIDAPTRPERCSMRAPRRSVFHRIHHARADPGAPHSRGASRPTSRRPLKSTACPHVHLYPQNGKSHGLARARRGNAQNCTSARPPPSPWKEFAHSSRCCGRARRAHALFMRRNEALTSIGRTRKFWRARSTDVVVGCVFRSERQSVSAEERERWTVAENHSPRSRDDGVCDSAGDRRVARHTEPRRLGGIHRERHAIEEADPCRSCVRAESERSHLPPADALQRRTSRSSRRAEPAAETRAGAGTRDAPGVSRLRLCRETASPSPDR